MRLRLDHLAVVARDLETGVAWTEERLGVALSPGGRHERFGTWNRLLGLGQGLYLEVIAPEPGTGPEGPLWFDLDRAPEIPRLGNWICAVEDLDAAGPDFGEVHDLARGSLSWKIAVPGSGSLPEGGGLPTLIEWGKGVTPPGQSLATEGAALTELVIRHPRAGALSGRISPGLEAPCPVRWEVSPEPSLAARFDTPRGPAWLE